MFEVTDAGEPRWGRRHAKPASGAMLVDVFEADCAEWQLALYAPALLSISRARPPSIFSLGFYGDCPRKQRC